MAHLTGMYRPNSDTLYMETVYPVLRQVPFNSTPYYPTWFATIKEFSILTMTEFSVCSMFSLLFLHFFLYGCNIFMWRKTRINYSFIFELAPTKELKYRDVFLICTTSLTAVIGVLFAHLALVAKGHSYAQVQAIPALLLLVIFAMFWIISVFTVS